MPPSEFGADGKTGFNALLDMNATNANVAALDEIAYALSAGGARKHPAAE
jgi:hypothetical protein